MYVLGVSLNSSLTTFVHFFFFFLQVCLHGNVDFSSVFVVINLQTWVLLLDFFGIGVPTPPPSRPSTPTRDTSPTRATSPTQTASPTRATFPKQATSPTTSSSATTTSTTTTTSSSTGEYSSQTSSSLPTENPNSSTTSTSGSITVISSSTSEQTSSQMDASLIADARAMLSLGSQPDDSLYLSTYQAPGTDQSTQATPQRSGGKQGKEGRVISDLSSMQEAYCTASASSLGAEGAGVRDQGSSVWGVEGKMSLQLKLNVKSLTVTFNKPEHPLARGGVSGVTAEVKLVRGNMEISGSLGQGSVLDMTETGAYYRER